MGCLTGQNCWGNAHVASVKAEGALYVSSACLLQVEATKFTEVGYHGRDVDQIVRDLVETSIGLVKKRCKKAAAKMVRRAVHVANCVTICSVRKPDVQCMVVPVFIVWLGVRLQAARLQAGILPQLS